MTVYGYRRVSTQYQADHGAGDELQGDDIAKRAVELGLEEPTDVFDVYTGKEQDRPELLALMARLGEGDVVIVQRVDRLARDLIAQEGILALFWKAGAEVLSCSVAETLVLRPDDESDPGRRLLRQILGAVAEYERALVQLRMKQGRARKIANGGFAGGPVPFGWRLVDGELVVDDNEAELVGILNDCRRAGMTLEAIADLMNGEHRLRRGKRWSTGSVNRALASWERVNGGGR